jgi:hypothetical protein
MGSGLATRRGSWRSPGTTSMTSLQHLRVREAVTRPDDHRPIGALGPIPRKSGPALAQVDSLRPRRTTRRADSAGKRRRRGAFHTARLRSTLDARHPARVHVDLDRDVERAAGRSAGNARRRRTPRRVAIEPPVVLPRGLRIVAGGRVGVWVRRSQARPTTSSPSDQRPLPWPPSQPTAARSATRSFGPPGGRIGSDGG